jgi:lantibiotic biosynthesis protein
MNQDFEKYLNIAEKLADSICHEAIWYENQCNWTGIFHDTGIANAKTIIRALPNNFYNGSAGVAYFLSAAFHQFQKPIYKETAIGAFEKTLGQIHQFKAEKIGFYEGLTGIAFSLIRSGEWFLEPKLIEDGVRIINKIIKNGQLEWKIDMYEGCTGAVPTLILLNQKYHFKDFEDFINGIGNYILDKITPSITNYPAGYSHGLSGLAHALAELYDFTEEEKYADLVLKIIQTENQTNWKQNLNDSAWCYGNAGIGFSRFICNQFLPNKVFLEDALLTLNRVSKISKKSQKYSLCHGFFGDLAYILWASKLTNSNKYDDLVFKKLNLKLKEYDYLALSLPDGTSLELNNPSFMLGWAGIGYFLLRLSNPSAFSEILMISTK